MKLPIGAVIYVQRAANKHFGVHTGDGYIVQFSSMDYKKNKETAIINRVCLAEFLGNDEWETDKIIEKSFDKDFKILSFSNLPVKNQNNINFDRSTIAQRAKSCIGCNYYNIDKDRYEKRATGYNLTKNNCEHFAIWCITGVHYSRQTNDVLNCIESFFGIGYSTDTLWYQQISDCGKANKQLNSKNIYETHNKVHITINGSDNSRKNSTSSTFICNSPGENSYATSKIGLRPGDQATINGTGNLSRFIKFNDDGCVYSIRLIENSSYIHYQYSIEIEAEGPHGFWSGGGYLLFTDKTGDTYSKQILDSTRKKHILDYNSERPEIIKIQWSNKPL